MVHAYWQPFIDRNPCSYHAKEWILIIFAVKSGVYVYV